MRPLAFLATLASCLGGCIPDAQIVPETPANAAQIASCKADATTANDLVVGGFVLSGGATGVGAVAAFETGTPVRTGLAITSAILAAGTGIVTGIHALAVSQFASGDCTAVVGPLGATPMGVRK